MATGPYDLGPFQVLTEINFPGGGWEFIAILNDSDMDNLGNPAFIKGRRSDGLLWAFNNTPAGDQRLFVINPTSGAILAEIATPITSYSAKRLEIDTPGFCTINPNNNDVWVAGRPTGDFFRFLIYALDAGSLTWSLIADFPVDPTYQFMRASYWNTTNNRLEGYFGRGSDNAGSGWRWGYWNGNNPVEQVAPAKWITIGNNDNWVGLWDEKEGHALTSFAGGGNTDLLKVDVGAGDYVSIGGTPPVGVDADKEATNMGSTTETKIWGLATPGFSVWEFNGTGYEILTDSNLLDFTAVGDSYVHWRGQGYSGGSLYVFADNFTQNRAEMWKFSR